MLRIVHVKSGVCACPDVAVRILDQASDMIVPQTAVIIHGMLEYLEMSPVVSVQAIFRPEPHETTAVLNDRVHGILRQAVLDVKPVEIQCLGT